MCVFFLSLGPDRQLPLSLWQRVNEMSTAAVSSLKRKKGKKKKKGKWKCGREPSPATSHQCFHVAEKGGGDKEGRWASLLRRLLTLLRGFSRENVHSADDTLVRMKNAAALNVAVIDA